MSSGIDVNVSRHLVCCRTCLPSCVSIGNGLVQANTDSLLCAVFESASVWFRMSLLVLGTGAVRIAVFGDAGGVQQLLIPTTLFVRRDLYLWIPAKSCLPPDRKKLASQCSPRHAAYLTALLVWSSIHFKAVLGIFIHTSTNTYSLKQWELRTCATSHCL